MRATRFVITLLALLAPGSALAMTTYVYGIIGPSFDFGPDATHWVEADLRSGVGGACTCK